MTIEQHFTAFNRLNGKPVTKDRLKDLLIAVKGVPGCEAIQKKLELALKKLKGYEGTDSLQFKPLLYSLGKIVEAPEKTRKAQLRAMFARLANDEAKPKKKSGKQPEPTPLPPPAEIPEPSPAEEKVIVKTVNDFVQDIPRDMAERAWAGISFSPERRGQSAREEYVITLNEFDQEFRPLAEKLGRLDEYERDFIAYRGSLKKLTQNWLTANSRVMSSMITGPANFPVERNRKKSDIAHKRLNELIEGPEAFRKKMRLKYRPDEEKPVRAEQENATEILEKKLKLAKDYQVRMVAVNKIIRSGKDVNQKLKDLGISEEGIDKLLHPKYNRRPGYASYELSNNNQEIHRLEDRLKQVSRLHEKQKSGNTNKRFATGSVVQNYELNRLQIIYDKKPDKETLRKLNARKFIWSGKNKAWQRTLNTPQWMIDEVTGDDVKLTGQLGKIPNSSPSPAAFINMQKKGRLWPQKRRKPGSYEPSGKAEKVKVTVKPKVIVKKPANLVAEEIPLNKIFTDTKRFQNRVDAFSEASANSVAEHYDPNLFDPIVVWADPKQKNKLFVLSGHSRYEGMVRRHAKAIPVRYFKGSEEAAIKFAKVEANRGATQETLIEDLAAYKLMRDGDSSKGLKKLTKGELAKIFKGKVQKLEAYSYLNPNGLFVEALSQANTSNFPYLERNAQWIGQLRRENPVISNQGEDNIFHFFYSDRSGRHLKLSKDDFFKQALKRINQLAKDESILFPECSSEGCKASAERESDPIKGESYKRLQVINETLASINDKLTSRDPKVRVSTEAEREYLIKDLAPKLKAEKDKIYRDLEILDKSQTNLFGPQYSFSPSASSMKKGKKKKKDSNELNKLQQAQLQDSIKAGSTVRVHPKARGPKKGWTDTPLFKNELDSRQTALFGFVKADQVKGSSKQIRWPGPAGEFLQDLDRHKMAIVIAGQPHSSKSELAKQVADSAISAGEEVALIDWEQGGTKSKHTRESIDRNVSPQNKRKLNVSGEVPRRLDALKTLAKQFSVIILDSGTKIEDTRSNAWIDELRESCPDTIWVILMQQTTTGGTKGGASAEFDAPIVIKTYRGNIADHRGNYAVLVKNRGNATGWSYYISDRKLVKDPDQNSNDDVG